MKHVFLVRHANSPFTAESDHQRPLSELGKEQAQNAAKFIRENLASQAPSIICSDALRTLTTAQIIANSFEQPVLAADVKYYHASVGLWCDAIAQSSGPLVLVGHNPTISQLADYMLQQKSPEFSPACVLHCALEIDPDGLKLPAQLLNQFKPNAIQ